VRNLGLIVTFWLAALTLPSSVLALGLGEIEVSSFLNQPLKAEIVVISARPGEIDDLLVSLASRDAFTRAGLSRPQHLAELRFAVNKSESGDSATISVTTRTAVKEPFLNFLIEADWAKGRVLREFTVLLDPPSYASSAPAAQAAATDQAESAVSAPVASGAVSGDSSEDSNVGTQPIALAENDNNNSTEIGQSNVSQSSNTGQADSVDGDIDVYKGDTLWGIASRYQDGEHSMGQIMLAIQRTNPRAFGNQNINNLKVGSVIRAPSAYELDQFSKREAYAQVLDQNGLWDDYVARVSGQSSSGITAEGSAGGGASGDSSSELSLVTPGDGNSNDAAGGNQLTNSLKAKLAMAEEELDAAKIENKDLESRIAELEARLSKTEELQKMIQIEDNSLAQMQSDQAEQNNVIVEPEVVSVEVPESTIAVTEEMATADEEALLEELLAEEAAAAAANQQSNDTLVDDESTQVMVAPPAPVIVSTPTPKQTSILDGILPDEIAGLLPPVMSILRDPIILGAVGGVIGLLLILFLIKRRKQSDNDESLISVDDGVDLDDEDLTPIHLAETSNEEDTNINVPNENDLIGKLDSVSSAELDDDEDDDPFSRTAIISQQDMAETSAQASAETPSTDEQDDVLNEVDVYLAYGLYDNAEDLLNDSIQNHPERADYRSKLLDTYFATKAKDKFIKEAENLKSMGEAANRHWDRVQVMGYELAPDNALFSEGRDSELTAADLEIAKPQEADFDLGSDEDDTNFSSSDFNLGEDDSEFGATQVTGGIDSNISQTQELPDFSDELPDLSFGEDDNDDTKIRGEEISEDIADLPDEIADLDFSFDDDEETDDSLAVHDSLGLETEIDSGGIDFELPDDLDLGDDDGGETDDGLTFDLGEVGEEDDIKIGADSEQNIEADIGDLDLGDLDLDSSDVDGLDDIDDLDLDSSDLDNLSDIVDLDLDSASDSSDEVIDFAETAIVDTTPDFEQTAIIRANDLPSEPEPMPDFEATAMMESIEVDDSEPSEINLGMDDTSFIPGILNDDDDGVKIDLDDIDDEFDISDDLEGFDELSDSSDSEEVAIDLDDSLDLDSESLRTGTFAPGDFDDEDSDDIELDDIEDLMLPDDVDEVSTKLDLARAFIDMGDTEGARASLNEVITEGSDEQKSEAQSLIDQL
jgi:pilus assembly protein FimV